MQDSGSPTGKVLIVDDETSVRAMLQAVLESDNYRVTTAVSATDASEKLALDDFDVVISDMRMETAKAGLDVVRAARQKSPQPVIIIITAFPMAQEEFESASIDAALTKPVPIAELFGTIEQLLAERVHSN